MRQPSKFENRPLTDAVSEFWAVAAAAATASPVGMLPTDQSPIAQSPPAAGFRKPNHSAKRPICNVVMPGH